MIARVSEAIQTAGGCILSAQPFSNLAIFIHLEVSGTRLPMLVSTLSGTGLQMDSRSVADIRGMTSFPDESDQTVNLCITFIHDEPDLRITVPSVPG